MWSLGCVIAELFLGWPLYPGASEYDQVTDTCATFQKKKHVLYAFFCVWHFYISSFERSYLSLQGGGAADAFPLKIPLTVPNDSCRASLFI